MYISLKTSVAHATKESRINTADVDIMVKEKLSNYVKERKNCSRAANEKRSLTISSVDISYPLFWGLTATTHLIDFSY